MIGAARDLTLPGREILGKRSGLDREFLIKEYDFRRPDKFAKDQIVTLEIIHETFARLAEIRLSSLLRMNCQARVALVDQLNFGEFIGSLPAKAVLATISLKPFIGSILVRFDTGLVAMALESLFGAATKDILSAAQEPLPEGLTDIELMTMERALSKFLPPIASAWEQVERLEPGLMSIETDPRLCQIVPPSEMIVLVEIETRIGELRGRIDLVYPFLTIEPIVHKLSAKYWYDSVGTAARPAASRSSPVYSVRLLSRLLFESDPMTIGDLRSLRRGDLVALPGLDRSEARLQLGEHEVMRLRLAEKLNREGYILAPLAPVETPRDGDDSGLLGETATIHQGLAGLERGLATISAGLQAGLSGLADRLVALENRQEAFEDRLIYGRADAAAIETKAEGRPFASLAAVQAEAFATILSRERPQFCALVLAWLEDAIAAAILDALPASTRTETVRRILGLEGAQPEVLVAAEGLLAKKLLGGPSDRSAPDGLHKVVGILNLARRETERQVVEGLEALDPAIADQVKKNMFVFEDISLLDGETIAILVGRVAEDDIILALKPLDAKTRGIVLARFEGGARSRILARVEAMGRVRLSECDAAGQRIVEEVRKIDEEGLMGLILPGEEI